jgi:hypothetical protein
MFGTEGDEIENWFLSTFEQYTRLHGGITQKIGIVTCTAVKTPKFVQLLSHIKTSIIEEGSFYAKCDQSS